MMAGERTRGVVWALALGVWGLGLARYLGEALHVLPFFSSPLAAGALGLGGVAVGLALWRAFPLPSRPRLADAGPMLLLPLAYLTARHPTPLAGAALLVGGAALAGAQLADGEERARWLYPSLLVTAVLCLYLRTMGRTVGEADSFEFQVIAPALGIAHPTGYPLYVLLGRLFALLPLGSVAWRVNLTSVVFSCASLLTLYLALRRVAVGPPVALLSALALAFSPLLWSQSVVAEVYALNLLFVAGVWALLIGLPGGAGRRRLWALSFLLGLSLTNHLTMVLLLPAVGLALLLAFRAEPVEGAGRRVGWRGWAVAAALFLAGLLVYAYIPLRWPALHDGRWMGAREFLSYVTGRQFGGALQMDLLRDPTRYGIVGRVLLEPFGWAGVVLAAVGLEWLVATRRPLALVSLLAFLPYCLYGLVYLVPDISVFLLPAHFMLAFWMGNGVEALLRLVGRRWRVLSRLSLALFALLPLSNVWLNLPAVDQSGRVGAEEWGRYVLGLPLAPNGAVLADGEKFAPLYYLQQVEGLRPDLDLVVRFDEAGYREELAARLDAGQTVYLARYLPHLEGFYLRSLGPLVEVGTGPVAAPPPDAVRVGASLWEGVELVAFDLEEDPQGRPLYHLTLYWRATEPVAEDLEVRLRLVDADGAVAWDAGGGRPVGGNYPTNGWPPGTLVPDYHPLYPPPWLPPGEYRLDVGLFPRFSGQGLPGGDDGPWHPLTALEVAAVGVADPLPHRVAFALGTAWLVGYDLPEEVGAGSPAVVDLAWEGVGGEIGVRLGLVAADGRVVAGTEVALPEGTVRSRHVITAPTAAGTYRLLVGLEGAEARCGWLARPAAACSLGALQVTPVQEGLANFDGRILLTAAEVGAGRLVPGEALPVTLRWRSLRALEEDYTVTVQLLGPDGLLHGQVDSWPVQGTRPTSGWEPGEEVTDPYLVPLALDAPAGRYRVVVGWYLLATMERLPVVDAAGQPVADHVVVAEIEVVR